VWKRRALTVRRCPRPGRRQRRGQKPAANPTALDFLGDLPLELGEPIASTIGAAGATIDIDDARLIAPGGAFDADTAVTAQTFSLDLMPDDDVWSRAYVVSTVGDVTLNAPVVIEVDRPASGTRAVQIIDGETSVVPVEGTDTARVEVQNFSEVVTMMIDDFNRQRAAEQARAEQGAADAAFFTSCFAAVSGLTGGDLFGDDGSSDSDRSDRPDGLHGVRR